MPLSRIGHFDYNASLHPAWVGLHARYWIQVDRHSPRTWARACGRALVEAERDDEAVAARGAGDALQLGAGAAQRAARRLNHSWLWMGAATADQRGNAGTYVSANAVNAAPWRAAPSLTLRALAPRF